MRFTGLVAATVTPFDSAGKVDTTPIPAMTDLLAKDGVSGLFICGSTGEGASLTTTERMTVAEAYLAANKGRMAAMVHVGHNCLEEAKALARHAEKIGAAAVGLVAPNYFKPGSVAALVAFCREVAAACPNTPFYHYHIPTLTGITFKMIDFLTEADGVIPNLAGIKYTHEDMMDFLLCAAFRDGKYDMLFGRDEMLLAGLATGARGAIGSTYNYSAPLYRRRIIAAYDKGDMATARLWQTRAAESIRVLIKYGGGAATKAFIRLRGVDCGANRLPVRTPSPAEEKQLEQDLRAIGHFAWLDEAIAG